MASLFSAQSPLLLWLLATAGLLVLAVWLYLWLCHHRFWTTRIPPVGQPLPATADLAAAPAVLVVIPARNEAEVIARTVSDVLLQDHAGHLQLVVVNDNSKDDTAQRATEAAQSVLAALPAQKAIRRSFKLINGSALPAGWSGKLWALEQGIGHGLGNAAYPQAGAADSAQPTSPADAQPTPATAAQPIAQPTPEANAQSISPAEAPQYVWLTDADIAHRPQVLRELLARAQSDKRALVSRMARLCTDSIAERWTIPAFVYFFQMLYPFAAIANERSKIHGAAGGCILLKTDYLRKIGGIAALRGALIDDCTLAAHVAQQGGRLWLELTDSSTSQRGYGGSKGVSDMIARTAYTQLRYSPLRLAGTVCGLIFTFFCPLLLPIATLLLLATTPAPIVPSAASTTQATATYTASTAQATATYATAHANPTPTVHACLDALPATLAIVCPLVAAVIMFGTFIPMLRFYKLSPLRTLALPLIATFYLYATLKSAVRHYRGKTGNWKGRVYQNG